MILGTFQDRLLPNWSANTNPYPKATNFYTPGSNPFGSIPTDKTFTHLNHRHQQFYILILDLVPFCQQITSITSLTPRLHPLPFISSLHFLYIHDIHRLQPLIWVYMVLKPPNPHVLGAGSAVLQLCLTGSGLVNGGYTTHSSNQPAASILSNTSFATKLGSKRAIRI